MTIKEYFREVSIEIVGYIFGAIILSMSYFIFNPVKKSTEIVSSSGNFSLRRIENVRGEKQSIKWIKDRLNNIQL